MYRQLDPDRIVDTADRLHRRIRERFHDSDLSRVAAELLSVTRGAQGRAEQIERPILSLRVGLGLTVAAIIAAALAIGSWIAMQNGPSNWADLMQGLDAGLNVLVLLGATVFFLVTVERQLKRRLALRALHELRVLAHVVELHQLTKDPERLVFTGLETPSSPTLSMTPFELTRYLGYCSEMLALIGNVSALYVRRLDDSVVLDAVDAIERLTAAISQKIWQKIQIASTLFGGAPPRGHTSRAALPNRSS
jgi:hypothetical protein